MVEINGTWVDLLKSAQYVHPLFLLPVGTVSMPGCQVWTYERDDRPRWEPPTHYRRAGETIPDGSVTLTLPGGTFVLPLDEIDPPRKRSVIRHDFRTVTTTEGEPWPSGRDVQIYQVFDVFTPGGLDGVFVTEQADYGTAHPLYLGGGVPDEASVPYTCPACRGVHHHGAGGDSGVAVLTGTHCLNAGGAGIDLAVLLPYAHPDPGSVLSRKEAAWLRRWQAQPGWRDGWPGQSAEQRRQWRDAQRRERCFA